MGSNVFLNTLTWWQWAVLAAIPPLIVLLYFLKLKRRPLEVPSTYLWHRTIEDLHVNAIWQRLRQNLLLFLQLLFIALLAFALLRPGWQGERFTDERLIFLIDTSASMSASDVSPSRLDEAKRQCEALIEAMDGSSVAMIISFSDRARVEQTFTDNKAILRTKLRAIEPTTHSSSLDEALRAAAGLANPGRTGSAADGDDVAATPLPAMLYILTDGGFRSIPNFALGALDPKYAKIGSDSPNNVAITAFATERNPERPGRLQAYGRIENFGSQEVSTSASLYLNGQLLDAQPVTIAARDATSGASGVQFELDDDSEGELMLQIDHKDDLEIDNRAFAVLNSPRPARVLLVTPGGNTALRLALTTGEAEKISQLTVVDVAHLETKQYQDEALGGLFDLIIYDRCVPKQPPQANTLFIGRVPPFEGWEQPEKQGNPAIIDVDRVHPLTQLVEMSNLIITQTNVLKPPRGGMTLIEADVGPVYAIAPRQSHEDAVLGFEITTTNAEGDDVAATDWPRRRSFPVFVMNAVKYLGGAGQQAQFGAVQPGAVYPIRTVLPVDLVTVKPPSGRPLEVRRENQNVINFTDTHETGVYEVREGSGSKLSQSFAVNLFDPRESDLQPAEVLPIGHERVEAVATRGGEIARKEIWKWILMLGLGIILLEWYIYNRRVYL
jgi:hypothetical protein